ncbi:MAG: hypothetical protein HRU19_07055 [Pseudobacteriovorax sp.]|nr:hypothetical protein [Pseudobacteriovorax sp.]
MIKTMLSGLIGVITYSGLGLSAPQPLVRDIGVVGLYSHDVFSWDRDEEVNTENGRLDLSTIFDYDDGKRLRRGGDPKNSGNAPVYSITMQLVDFYKEKLRTLPGDRQTREINARKETVALFHKWVRESFARLTGLEFPTEAIDEAVTNSEQATMRAMHDILPGRIDLKRRFALVKSFRVTDWKFNRLRLNEDELNQPIPTFDGAYAPEYRDISIPFTNVNIDLRKVDKDFVETFSGYDFELMQEELQLLGSDQIRFNDLSFSADLILMLKKSLCSNNNPWMPVTSCI